MVLCLHVNICQSSHTYAPLPVKIELVTTLQNLLITATNTDVYPLWEVE